MVPAYLNEFAAAVSSMGEQETLSRMSGLAFDAHGWISARALHSVVDTHLSQAYHMGNQNPKR